MQKKYVVKLSEEERTYLLELMDNGQATPGELRRGGMLLKLDENEENNEWTQTTIAEAHGRKRYAVIALAKRYVEEGLQVALGHASARNGRRLKIDGKVQEKLIELACSPPPEEKPRWTAQLLADESVRQGFVKSISSSSVLIVLQKVNLSHCPFAPKKLPRKKKSLVDAY